jgi:hypothetical protein
VGNLGRDAPHKYCVNCHKAEAAGPRNCQDCHEGAKK